ncbi:HAMP domain-containing histidine kinase [Candidatus Synechococcus calcipolaris G9]|uniref:histidine kinase n=1 Tax=Candidatus Synechococcus calcipolaris G9 TaxID=1497997 RepID=A0ABT6EVG6_9SYNE|nr:HAMP domain-containing sensor histidine kinase [Candidatus Synechococcus calcipolaris]MDG2989783.1 HAMP domain-containing histidine kinase [Candidatus Synechococcus calcipolaris G9]
MHPILSSILRRFSRRQLSTSSLQFRLTLELVILSILGLGSVTVWAGWQLEQNLVAGHKQTLEYIAMRFPEQLELYSDFDQVETGLEQTIHRVASPGLAIWVESPEGNLLAHSPHLEPASPTIRQVHTLANIPERPQVVRFGDRDIVLCGTPLNLAGESFGKLYLVQDITEDQQKLNAGLWRLLWVSFLAIAILIAAISKRICKAMEPLEQMSQVASAISADDLKGAKLELNRAPDEILGLAKSFNEMLFRLSGAWEQQQQFVGNVSHELRTPLTVVVGYLRSLLHRGTNLNTYQQHALETATAETERTIRMLQDLLDLARVDNGHLHFRLAPVILNTLVAEVAAMSQKVSHRQINLLITQEDIVVCADQDRLQQVLINLVDNAIKYSEPEEPIDLVLEKKEKWALIHIQDHGIGIPFPHQQRIFERFYRVDESMTRSRDGTGLGLAIAKSLVEGMQGRITLRSSPQEGSIFTIMIPIWIPPK